MSQRVNLTELYPPFPDEDAITYTGRVLSHAREHGTNRQCSIGYHEECSDPAGESCMCICHTPVTDWTVEGHVEGGVFAVTRAEQGRHMWPPVKGEPATAWAHWVLASSEADAWMRAVNKQAAVLRLDPVKPEYMPRPEAPEGPGITLTRGQLEAWAQRELTDEEVEALDMRIPESSIPEAIQTMIENPY